MKILAIESSCDETAASVSLDGRTILSDVVYSQADMHALYGGVVPEIASRKHIEKISLVAEQALKNAGLTMADIDAVAATCAPGLIGALLVGANFAKACAQALDKPFIPVHHIRGHVAANYIAFPDLRPPFIALVASGGHTVILDVQDYTKIEVVGTTRDDAAGEAFDKTARMLGLPYPGGASLDKLAREGKVGTYRLPRAGVSGAPYDFSFSGLKTAAVNLIHNAQQKEQEICREDLALEIATAVADTVVPRVVAAAKERGRTAIAAAGGVAANSILRGMLQTQCDKAGLALYLPPLKLCGDNGSMIACQAYYEYLAGNTAPVDQNCYATMPAGTDLTRVEA
ncbi:MAG: tRNA (adenosine(37)-N6)-threonylcarbamoyltransferase complex transferase subunit TsaD [Clostridia bacterium]|nr:tRNA (adenosine(37)-N6)-threonylcarbamoyltransferase complex transferase subunit TsaD [Clostridia bacterium]